MIEEDINDDLRFRTIYIAEIFITEDERGMVDSMLRKFYLPARTVMLKFGEANLPKNLKDKAKSYPHEEVPILHLVMPNEEFGIAKGNKGKVVRIVGAVGDNPLIATASYEDDANSANTLGITNETIPNDDFGYVITEGTLLGIDTSAFTVGQLLYLGATGSIIGTAPVAPLHAVRLGQVLRVQLNAGSMYVRIDNGYEIGELHDVRDTTTTGSYGDLLVKSGSIWVNSKQLTGSYGLTGSLQATSFTGSLFGTSSFATSASYAGNASNATSASYALSASYAMSASDIPG